MQESPSCYKLRKNCRLNVPKKDNHTFFELQQDHIIEQNYKFYDLALIIVSLRPVKVLSFYFFVWLSTSLVF